MASEKTLILDSEQIDQRIIRMAYEIYEHNIERKKLILAGVSDNGFKIASLINDQLSIISEITTNIVKVDINKEQPLKEEIQIPLTKKELENQSIIIIDDVLNSGRTVAFVLKAFLNVHVKKIEVATIINRSHKAFPIYPKYVGYELATTINEHVEVIVSGNDKGAFLY
ncbi:phosphoribosyltransferase family protein [Reichenbachiella versicolor]|uniref:phosphoribosyltransferase family protein n=1 Tax=Reichenbachiella versicolor TaxID=1821036 RepID=UPI000D6E3434|nr:phosphoribosyltransferase family protein [Reichenbachiella versicolor]